MVGCGTPAPAASPSVSTREAACSSSAPAGSIEASLADLRRDESAARAHELAIVGKSGSSLTAGVDELTAEFVERFREDRRSALEWANARSELRAAVAPAPRVRHAHYALEGDSFVLRIHGDDGVLETSHPFALLVSGAPLFVAHEALEGFPY